MDGKAIVVVDMQDAFLEGIARPERKILCFTQSEVLRYAKEIDVPVVLTEFRGIGKTTEKIRGEFERFKRKARVIKSENNGFARTNLGEVLSNWKARDLYFMGVSGVACVTATAEGALERGFNVFASDDTVYNNKWAERYPKWCVENGTYFSDYREMLAHLDG